MYISISLNNLPKSCRRILDVLRYLMLQFSWEYGIGVENA